MSSINKFDHLRVSLDAIKLATNNFNEKNYINKGGFGKVYKGELWHHEKLVMVAVKRLDRTHGQGTPEFWKEIRMLSQYKHENLVSLLGFCDEGSEEILVYEYLSNKSLDLYLNNPNLWWLQRLNICIGAARGLEYLHNSSGTKQTVLHRDIKSSNILLDEKWNAKISDFGLSKLVPANQKNTFLFSNPAGTHGYIDPLYIERWYLTKESDVYSFGVMLFEVLCGRSGLVNYNDSPKLLSELARNYYEEKKIGTIVPDFLRKQIEPNCLNIYVDIAYQCLQKYPNKRPSAAYVVKQLENALEYQLNPSLILEYTLLHGVEPNPNNARATVRAASQARARTQAALDTNEKELRVIEAIKIQRAYRCHRKRRQMAAARIQYFFRKVIDGEYSLHQHVQTEYKIEAADMKRLAANPVNNKLRKRHDICHLKLLTGIFILIITCMQFMLKCDLSC